MPKTRTNVSIDSATLEEARAYGLNVSGIAEAAVTEALRHERARRWHEDHAEALERYRDRIEREGTLLAGWQSLKVPGLTPE